MPGKRGRSHVESSASSDASSTENQPRRGNPPERTVALRVSKTVSSLITVETAIKTVTTPAKNSHLSKGPSERCRARNSVKPTRSVKTEKRSPEIDIPTPSSSPVDKTTRHPQKHKKLSHSSPEIEVPVTVLPGPSHGNQKTTQNRSRNKRNETTTARKHVPNRVQYSTRIRHHTGFGYRSRTPPGETFQQETAQRLLVTESRNFTRKELEVQKKRFGWCMGNLREKQTQFNGADATGADVIFLSESCYRKGKITGVAVKPVGLEFIPKEMLKGFPEYSVKEFPMQMYIVKFHGCPHEDDNHHMEYIPVYEVCPLKPSDSHHVEMLLLAYHWNNAAILRNPEAHHKARYESFFTLEPEEYVALQDEWKAMTGETGKFLDSIA